MKYRITLINRNTASTHIIDGYPVVVDTTDAEKTEAVLMENRDSKQFYCIRERVG